MRHTPPYSNKYRFTITQKYAGLSLLEFYTKRFSFKSQEYWAQLIAKEHSTVNYQNVSADYELKIDDVVHTIRDDVTEPDVNDTIDIIYNDGGILVLNKPAPVAVHPCGRYFKNSLTEILKEKYPDNNFHTIHRLDVWTTGVLVFATHEEQARFLHTQFENKKIKKLYAVLAKGNVSDQPITITEPIGRADHGHRGYGSHLKNTKDCITEFTPLLKKNDITLLKANPITGRTNQIRVHVQCMGGNVLNDPIYFEGFDGIVNENIPFLGLHCRQMEFNISQESEKIFQASWPKHYTDIFSEEELNSVF